MVLNYIHKVKSVQLTSSSSSLCSIKVNKSSLPVDLIIVVDLA